MPSKLRVQGVDRVVGGDSGIDAVEFDEHEAESGSIVRGIEGNRRAALRMDAPAVAEDRRGHGMECLERGIGAAVHQHGLADVEEVVRGERIGVGSESAGPRIMQRSEVRRVASAVATSTPIGNLYTHFIGGKRVAADGEPDLVRPEPGTDR